MPDYRIANAQQARLLLEIHMRPLLTLLMQKPRSVSELAKALGLNLNRVNYLMGKLLRAEVATVQSVQPRRGRAIKRYAVPSRWFIPFEVTQAETLLALTRAQFIPRIEQVLSRSLPILQDAKSVRPGFWMNAENIDYGDETGPVTMFVSEEPFMLSLGKSRFTDAQAREFKKRLLALLEEFESHAHDDPIYTLGLILVRGDLDT